jgi:hypothetical protein
MPSNMRPGSPRNSAAQGDHTAGDDSAVIAKVTNRRGPAMILVTCATHGTRSPRAAPFLRLAQRGRVKSRDCVISSSQATRLSSRSLAWPPVTSQVPEPLLRLFALLPHCGTASPRCQRYQRRLRPGNERTPAKLAFSLGFLVLFSSGYLLP